MTEKQAKTSRLEPLRDSDRSFDLVYWSKQTPAARMAAIWEMTTFHHKLKKRDPNELRLNRSVGGLRPRKD